MDLFEANRRQTLERAAPLSARMRPRTLDEIVGHADIVGPGETSAGTGSQNGL